MLSSKMLTCLFRREGMWFQAYLRSTEHQHRASGYSETFGGHLVDQKYPMYLVVCLKACIKNLNSDTSRSDIWCRFFPVTRLVRKDALQFLPKNLLHCILYSSQMPNSLCLKEEIYLYKIKRFCLLLVKKKKKIGNQKLFQQLKPFFLAF